MIDVKKIAKEITAVGREGDIDFFIIGDNVVTMTLDIYRSPSGLSTDQIPRIESDFLKVFEKIKFSIKKNFKLTKFSNEGKYVLMRIFIGKYFSFRKSIEIQSNIDLESVFLPTMKRELESEGFEVSIR